MLDHRLESRSRKAKGKLLRRCQILCQGQRLSDSLISMMLLAKIQDRICSLHNTTAKGLTGPCAGLQIQICPALKAAPRAVEEAVNKLQGSDRHLVESLESSRILPFSFMIAILAGSIPAVHSDGSWHSQHDQRSDLGFDTLRGIHQTRRCNYASFSSLTVVSRMIVSA